MPKRFVQVMLSGWSSKISRMTGGEKNMSISARIGRASIRAKNGTIWNVLLTITVNIIDWYFAKSGKHHCFHEYIVYLEKEKKRAKK